ncbi:MAG: NYN domain-containing protein [Candidatus Sungbacteria bacterium]|nr:NYN domain-containing protein [Candidatus Sungbacteria bacterium]
MISNGVALLIDLENLIDLFVRIGLPSSYSDIVGAVEHVVSTRRPYRIEKRFVFVTSKTVQTIVSSPEHQAGLYVLCRMGYFVVLSASYDQAADDRMNEVIQFCMRHPDIDMVAIATHDKGFVPALKAVHDAGKETFVIGVDSVPPEFRAVARYYHAIRNPNDPLRQPMGVLLAQLKEATLPAAEELPAMHARQLLGQLVPVLQELCTEQRSLGFESIVAELRRIGGEKPRIVDIISRYGGNNTLRIVLNLLIQESDLLVRTFGPNRTFYVFNPQSIVVKMLPSF